MQELTKIEIEYVSGAGVLGLLGKAAHTICSSLYYSGLNARECGMGDMYLEAVRGGNMGA
jgi:hypothetical protein